MLEVAGMAQLGRHYLAATLMGLLLLFAAVGFCRAAAPRQASLDEWRAITAPTAPVPRVFVKGDQIRFYFRSDTNVIEFGAHWSRLRVPTEGYRINSALLRWNQKLPRMPRGDRGWREATLIAGPVPRSAGGSLLGCHRRAAGECDC
jgi:hypothetical protein